MFRTAERNRSVRGGFTLLELMIVLVLLALLVGIVWPSLRRPLDRSATKQAARQLVGDLSQARFHAIETGRTMLFRYEPLGSRYWILPADALSEDGDSALDQRDVFETPDVASSQDADEPADDLQIQGTLEYGVAFQDPRMIEEADFPLGSTLSDTLSDEMAETELVEPSVLDADSEVSWSAPVLIYPTGRAENAQFILRGQDGYQVTVTLRGLTGALTIGPLERDPLRVDSQQTGDERDLRDVAPGDVPVTTEAFE